ncbi:guanine nucleotide exchange factor for Rab-3A isoform X2 [Bombina bombina]|uniref:guanine nucleotide exchange factor for Rab-3A isoform X2 n=1 Tax=Bombina bombina TaxID=8345 RepID=UPI00235B2C89|nr:guanine nucleotide exchange factor for Rab-3A isoform X2 [Bombina bombina]
MWRAGHPTVQDGVPQHCRSPSFEECTNLPEPKASIPPKPKVLTTPRPEASRPATERSSDTTTYDLSRLRSSSVEIREKGSEFLREELLRAQKELKLRDEECERLSKVREQLEQELEELTASLFEEAHKMVRDANTKKAASEKQLQEAHGKIDMLQAEVTALKTLVLTSTPSSPNRDLHPQLQSPSKNALRKGHSRNKSVGCAAISPSSAPVQPISSEAKEVDALLLSEFLTWKESPTLDRTCTFLSRIYREDITPCLDFAKRELSEQVLTAVERNTLSVEPVVQPTLPVVKASAVQRGGPRKCALSGLSRSCRHRIKLGDSENYYFISPSCRYRITAVCNFFTYIRYIQQGLVRQDTELVFWEIMRLRREMSMAKLGFYINDL